MTSRTYRRDQQRQLLNRMSRTSNPAACNRIRREYDRRDRAQARTGMALVLASLLGFAAMLYGAYSLDAARGVTVSQSLEDWGL